MGRKGDAARFQKTSCVPFSPPNPQGERTTWQYDPNSRVTVQRLANLIRVSYAYDNGDRLVRLANLTAAGTTITSYVDTWDPANNRQARVEQDGTLVTWSYDPTYQLTRERRSGAHSYDTTYAYDPAGNRRVKLDNAVRTTYLYDVANQLQTYVDNTGTTTFGFDASGNQRLQQTPSSGTTTNTWDFESRLTTVALPSGVLNTFTYNADGLRVQRQDSSGTSKQIWDGQKIVEEIDQNNVAQVVYTQSDGVYGDVASQRRSGVARYFLLDPLGSTTRLTDGSQSVTDSYVFKAFGESLLAGTTANPFRYVGSAGYYFDADLSWLYLRAREYRPSEGRLLSLDPLPLAIGRGGSIYIDDRYTALFNNTGKHSPEPLFDPVTASTASDILENGGPYTRALLAAWPNIEPIAADVCLYRYVESNPLVYTDPAGLTPRRKMARCAGTRYNPEVSCCENRMIVAKVTIWLCQRTLDIPTHPYAVWCGYHVSAIVPDPWDFRHSYVCCGGPNVDCYGKQAEKAKGCPTKKGDPIPHEGLATGSCEPEKVCPSTKRSKCVNPVANKDYGLACPGYENCHDWARCGLK